MPAPKRAVGPPLASPEGRAANRVDLALGEAEAAAAKISAEEQGDGNPELLEELDSELLARVADLRAVIVGLLREYHCGRDYLMPVFGGTSTRLDRIFQVLQNAQLPNEDVQDQRIQDCMESCNSIKRALESASPPPEILRRRHSTTEPAKELPVPPAPGELRPTDDPEGGEPPGGEPRDGPDAETETLPSVDSEGELPAAPLDERVEQPVSSQRFPPSSPPLTPRQESENVHFSPEPDVCPYIAETPVHEDMASDSPPAETMMNKVAEDPPQTPSPRKLREFHEHIFASGSRYKGEWLNGVRHGVGAQIWPGGEKYEGQFKRGGVTGEGVYCQPDGMCHTGQWKRGKQHGHGSETFPDGTRYDGQWVAGCKTGRGTYTFAEGSVYEGDFLDNNIHGHGTYIWAGGGNGRKYHGQWSKNQMHGSGDFTFADGRRYSGEYMFDQKAGQGTFSWPDGCEYRGQWVKGKQHGKGEFTDATGELHEGVWEEGKLVTPTV